MHAHVLSGCTTASQSGNWPSSPWPTEMLSKYMSSATPENVGVGSLCRVVRGDW